MASASRNLQSRVGQAVADRFAAIAAAKGMTESELVRESIMNTIRSADVAQLQDALRVEYEEKLRALAETELAPEIEESTGRRR
ncbi:hypothetical protein ACFV24_27115 [Nocardia fluminea]|uniref:hypothetical protein n=1 Tax=Nocardia fluminea TaxID=134984 RepID=UPI003672EF9E